MAAREEKSHHKNRRLEAKSLTEHRDLPNEVLIRILSLLPTKSAAATSLVSTRWRYLWLSITNLDFSEHIMFGNQRNRFIDFMDKAIILRGNSSLVSFSLRCSVLADASRVNSWITYAIRCNVQDLTLDLQIVELESQYLLPCSLFGSQSLVTLELSMSGGYIFRLPHTFNGNLIRLKYLTLSSITFSDDGSIEKLISACPLLQELHIWWCNYSENVEFISIFAPKLEILEIDDRDGDYGGATVCIVGENLKSFTYGGILNNEYQIRSTQLDDADISLRYGADYDDVAPNRCYKILNGLSGVQKLTLTEYFLENLEYQLELIHTIPVFERLTELCVYIKGSSEIHMDRVLMKIFEKCPHLENLIISEPFSTFSELNPVPSCFQTHLKRVTVHHHIPDNEDCAINMFLSNATILEDLEVFCRLDAFDDHRNAYYVYSYKIEEYRQELNQRTKVSKDCRISVLFDTF